MYLRRQYLCICNWDVIIASRSVNLKNKKFHIFFKGFCRHKKGNFETLRFSGIKCTIDNKNVFYLHKNKKLF